MNIATLGMSIDSSEAAAAATDLDRMTQAGVRAEKVAKSVGDVMADAAAKFGNASKQSEGVKRVLEQGSDAMRKQQAELAALLGKIDPVVGALGRLDEMEEKLRKHAASGILPAEDFASYSAKITEMRTRLSGADDQMQKTGMTAKQTAQSLRMLPMQFTDIAVSLAGGQSPFLVMLQQGGQIKDSFGGIGAAASAMGGYISGLVNPFTIAAGAAVALGAAAYSAESRLRDVMSVYAQFFAMDRQVSTSGIESLISRVSQLPDVSRSAAIAMVSEFAKIRQIGTDFIEPLSAISADFAVAIGAAPVEAAKRLAAAFADPVRGAQQLDEQLNILTADQMLSINAMVEHGDKIGAQRILLEALLDAIQNLHEQGMTPLKMATNELGNSFQSMMASIGRSDGLRNFNALLARSIDMVSWLINNLPNIVNYPVLKYGAPGMMFRSMGVGEKPSSNEVSGKIKGAPSAKSDGYDERIKNILAETSAYKSQAAVIENLNEKRSRFRSALSDAEKRGDTKAAKELKDGIAGISERIAAEEKKGRGRTHRPRAVTDDLGTRMLQQYREREALLKSEMLSTDKLTESQKDLAKFEQLITDLRKKRETGSLTASQKGLLAKGDEIRKQLQLTAGLEEEKQKKEALQKLNERALQIQAAIASAQENRQEQYDRELAAIGMGSKDQQRTAGMAQLVTEYRRYQDQLAKKADFGEIDPAEYQKRKDEIQAQLGVELAMYEKHYSDIDAAQARWENGASRAIADYVDSSRNMMGQMNGLFTNAFTGMEDAMVKFVKTGKISLADLADSFISELVRMSAKAVNSPLAGMLGSAIDSWIGGGDTASTNLNFGSTTPDYVGGFTFATGGHVAGPGTGTSDSIPAWLSNGEYVINAAAVQRYGKGTFDRLNAQKFATGGHVGPAANDASAAPNVRLELINRSSQPVTASQGDMRFDGKSYVQQIFLDDMRRGGPMSRAMGRR